MKLYHFGRKFLVNAQEKKIFASKKTAPPLNITETVEAYEAKPLKRYEYLSLHEFIY